MNVEAMVRVVFLSIWVAAFAIWRSDRFYENVSVSLPRLVQCGIDAVCEGAFVTARDPGNVNSAWFHDRTLILGYDKHNARGRAEAVFRFPIPRSVTATTETRASLTVQAERVHGGLHSHLGPKQVKAVVEANDQRLDEFWLIDRMPNGQDYGFRNVGPIPIDARLLRTSELRIKLSIDEQAAWDIDEVALSVEIKRRQLTVHGSMILGALISAGIGLLPTVL